MKTALQNFEQIISILKAVYPIVRDGNPYKVEISIYQKENIELILEDEILTVIAGENINNVYTLDGTTNASDIATAIEKVIIEYAELKHEPYALLVYLYYSLLGILWGIKAHNNIKDANPIPEHATYITFDGHSRDNGEIYIYEYLATNSGYIKLIRVTPDYSSYEFMPEEYIRNPEKIIQNFFMFLKDIDYIESVSTKTKEELW